jgi:alanyl-tRNA synthetase
VHRQLKDRLVQERESAVDAERVVTQKRLGEAAERYEANAQQARMRLVAEHDRRLAEAEDTWRAERKALQEKVNNSAQALKELEQAKDRAIVEIRDKERQMHAAALQVRSSCETGFTCWKVGTYELIEGVVHAGVEVPI